MQQIVISEKKKELRILEEQVKQSWLNDADKVVEFNELISILEKILEKNTIEEYFDGNESDIQYFITKFSASVISNILKQYSVYGRNGDDVAYQVLLQYLKLFDKFLHNPKYLPLFSSIKEIFEWNKNFYRGYALATVKSKKNLSADEYNVKNVYLL